MKPLEPPDSFHLRAAEGWIELGAAAEAAAEVERLAPEHRVRPEVLNVRWEICAAQKNWVASLEIATALVKLAPEVPLGWVHRSYSLHELKQTAEARDNLMAVVDRFPDDATIRYNLACYECQLGSLDRAREWLRKAFTLGDSSRIRQMALNDPDLRALHNEIERL